MYSPYLSSHAFVFSGVAFVCFGWREEEKGKEKAEEAEGLRGKL